MTDEADQQKLAENIGKRLADLLREANGLDGHGEKALDKYLYGLDDRTSLSDRLCQINFRYGPGVIDAIPSWSVRYDFITENDPKGEIQTDSAMALLLINEVLFINTRYFKKEWPEEARKSLYLGVNCGDVFAWGCSDLEEITLAQINTLFAMWEKDPVHGHEIWCIIQRQELPQSPVAKNISERGIWNLEDLTLEYGLRANYYDGTSSVYAGHQYETYSNWCKEQGREPLPFDVGWWEGWREFIKACPQWRTDAWKAEQDQRRNTWCTANGFNPG